MPIFSVYAVAPEAVAVLGFLLFSILLTLVCLPVMLCCSKRKKKPSSPYTKRKEVLAKKGLFTLMLAHLDEFDQLTPLVATPSPSNSSGSSSQLMPRESDSPPPPRRPQHGRTLLVPLQGRYRSPAVPLLGTPDSRVTSIDQGTTKSCATIPEDDEEVDDLMSIDRTSISHSDPRPIRWPTSISAYNVALPQPIPQFTRSTKSDPFPIPTPSYSAPEVPKCPLQPTRSISNHSVASFQSSNGTGSPVDTTGSVSDSFYINSDVISSTNGSQVIDGCGESDIQAKYYLHRIEEESLDELSGIRGVDDAIPRSISQQFELLLRRV